MQGDFTERMTAISYKAFDAATKTGVSAQEAAAMLMDHVEIRKFDDILYQFVPKPDARATLVEGLCADDPSRSRASIDKKVRGWLSGKYQPTAREDLLELCFVLRLNAADADAFLAMAGEEGLHWRDPRELVYAFALRHEMNYLQATALLKRVLPETEKADGEAPPDSFTPLIHQEAAEINTEEELKRYLAHTSSRLGSLHNSAYRQLMDFMQVLEKPQSYDGSEEARYTTREIVEKYLDKKLPSTRQGKKLDEKHRGILADWPDEITLSRMKNRKIDVTRKVLMLLFLATDGGEASAEDWLDEDWDEEEAEDQAAEADAAFRSSYIRMNQMLSSCGYRMLDPRNPFDWVALYCMRVEDESVSIDGLNERLSHVLDVLFAAAEPEV